MMGANSKRKGNAGELELCKLLTETLTGSFVRVPNSGAAVGGKNVVRRLTLSKGQDRTFRGDIIPPDHLPRLVIEAKSYGAFGFHALIQAGPYAFLDNWIKQTISVVDPGDQWFVAFKIVFRGWYLVLPENQCRDYKFGNYCAYTGAHGAARVTDLISFFRTNREAVCRKAGPAGDGQPTEVLRRGRSTVAPKRLVR